MWHVHLFLAFTLLCIMTGQFLSGHVAVKQVEGKTFWLRRSSSVTIPDNWWRPSRLKCLTFNLFYCYVSAEELPSHTFAVAMSLYQILCIMYALCTESTYVLYVQLCTDSSALYVLYVPISCAVCGIVHSSLWLLGCIQPTYCTYMHVTTYVQDILS